MCLAAPRHAGASWIRDRTHVSYNGRRILNQLDSREAPTLTSFEDQHQSGRVQRLTDDHLRDHQHLRPGNQGVQGWVWVFKFPMADELRDGPSQCLIFSAPAQNFVSFVFVWALIIAE